MSDPVLEPILKQHNTLAVIDNGRRYSYSDIQTSSCKLASCLDRLNLDTGSRVAILLPNSLLAVNAFLAVVRGGYSYVPMNIGLKQDELERLFNKLGIDVVLCMAAMKGQVPVRSQLLAVDEVLASSDDDVPTRDHFRHSLSPDREFVCLSTSGSTGEPRIVARSAEAINVNVLSVSAGLQVTAGDRFLSVVPFWHANGFSNCLMLPLFNGAGLITMKRFMPRPMLNLILTENPSVVIGSPFVFRALSQVIEPTTDLSHVRAWVSSGAALPAELDEKLRKQNIQVRQLYGSSETGTISISSGTPAEIGNVGNPLLGVKVRIADEKDQPVSAGQIGNIQVNSSALFSGYAGLNSDDIPMTDDGYYRMSDLGLKDPHGRLVLTGRADSMINISGVKVDPVEIQNTLTSMPGISQALVFGAKDANGMETVRAILVAKHKIGTNEVLSFCREHLAEYKLPRRIEWVDEIPQNLMGKTTRKLIEN